MPNKPLTVTVQQDVDGYLFHVSRTDEGGKRKRQKLRLSFSDEAGIIEVPKASQMREYCTDGRFTFEQVAKSDLFGGKDAQVFIPFKLFDWMKSGRRLTANIQVLSDNGIASGEGELPLMIDGSNRAIKYTAQAYLQYLGMQGSDAEKLAFAGQYVQKPDVANSDAVVAMLNAIAQKSPEGQAEYCLYQLYGNPSFMQNDPAASRAWLEKSGEKQCDSALRVLEEEAAELSRLAAKEGSPVPDSLEECMACARSGNKQAQFELYRRLKESDPAESGEWLMKAASAGYDPAVEQLEGYYAGQYQVEGDVGSYIGQLEEAAGHQSTAALYRLFTIYYTGSCLGRSMKKDMRVSLDYLKRAADSGMKEACYRLWQTFEEGNDLLVDANEAVNYLSRASDAGIPMAMNDLGELYVTGRIVARDDENGVALIRRAAEENCFEAQMRVYRMALEGRYYHILFDIDPQGAYRLLQGYASESGNYLAQYRLWESYTESNPVMLTRPEALRYLERAAEGGYGPAMFALANVLLGGCYRDIDTARGQELLERGAKLGHAKSQFALYQLYYTGRYLALEAPVNKERAYKWISRACASLPEAQEQMWEMFAAGNEMGLEQPEALDMLFSSARHHCGDALYAAAGLFAEGRYVPGDTVRAVRYLNLAAAGRHARARYKLYEVYDSGSFAGKPVEREPETAMRMLLLSAEQGFPEACEEVCRLFLEGKGGEIDRTFAESCGLKEPTVSAKKGKPEKEPAPEPSPAADTEEAKEG